MKKPAIPWGPGPSLFLMKDTCLVGATLNLIQYFARESCGLLHPLPGRAALHAGFAVAHGGGGRPGRIHPHAQQMARHMDNSYCAFAPGAAEPVLGLLRYFEDEVREHISQRQCPCPPPGKDLLWSAGTFLGRHHLVGRDFRRS